MTEETIWVSRIMMDSTLVKGFDSDLFLKDPDGALDAMEKSRAGVPLPADRFPNEFYAHNTGKLYKKQPDIFLAGGYWTVSADCAEVLRQFDLGKTSLYPTKLFQYDRERRIEGEYFCINFGEKKEAFSPAESPRATKVYPKHELRQIPFDMKDGDIAVKRAALEGVDLWLDEALWKSVFLSGRLVKALRAAKLTRRFGLGKCRVV